MNIMGRASNYKSGLRKKKRFTWRKKEKWITSLDNDEGPACYLNLCLGIDPIWGETLGTKKDSTLDGEGHDLLGESREIEKEK